MGEEGGTPASGYDNVLTGVPGEDAAAGAVLIHLPSTTRVTRILGTRAGNRYGYAVGPRASRSAAAHPGPGVGAVGPQ